MFRITSLKASLTWKQIGTGTNSVDDLTLSNYNEVAIRVYSPNWGVYGIRTIPVLALTSTVTTYGNDEGTGTYGISRIVIRASLTKVEAVGVVNGNSVSNLAITVYGR